MGTFLVLDTHENVEDVINTGHLALIKMEVSYFVKLISCVLTTEPIAWNSP